ncbi:MAG: alanine dehydrogenase [Bacteroidetes bacterium]|nr:MAG: alanine dehydrogenase [Bacteroidota bacterium]
MKKSFSDLAQAHAMYPEEQLQKVNLKHKSLFIGIPREIEEYESRLILTPEGVAVLVNNGHEVWMESKSGETAKYSDLDYSNAGAKIVYSTKEVYQADIILKVMPPTLMEVDYMRAGQILISALQLAKVSQEYIEAVIEKRVTGLALEFIEDKVGGKPIVRAMSEISGSTVMLIAAEYLSSANEGKGIILGGITGVPPTKVVILGAGTVAEYAARTAMGLGAEVKIFDNHIYKLRRLKQNLGAHIYTSTIDTYTLTQALADADVVIGAIRAEDDRSPCVVTSEMISRMKSDSVIVDVSIDQGGCFETSRLTSLKKPTYKVHDVIHYCVPNIASRVARTATTALSNIFTPMLLQIANHGGLEEAIFNKDWLMKGVYAYKGSLTNQMLSKRFDLKYKDMKLFMISRL